MSIRRGLLVLADGTEFAGELIGAEPVSGNVSGEVVFHTGLTGYQEVLSDPSYAGQIVTFTTPHIGNYGTTPIDNEATRVHARGLVVREMARRRSNWRANHDFDEYLRGMNVTGIAGVDTRKLTKILRSSGSMSGAIGESSAKDLLHAAQAERGTAGVDLVGQVTTRETYEVGSGPWKVVAMDFGIKSTILACLAQLATVKVVPATTSWDEIRRLQPDGVFLSNGPGDPEQATSAVSVVREILDAGVPLFGICLGHQILSLALDGKTFKLPFGHHGANHPVRDVTTGRVEITSQNHNFCVDASSLGDKVKVTHVNLNDETNEGMTVVGSRAFSVQYHPEAGPGPHDSRYLFDRFRTLMEVR